MRKLVISWRSYDWVYSCAGIIMKEPAKFDVIVICSDDDVPILKFPELCRGAVYVQRSYDLSRIGKEIGVGKLMNFRYDPDCINIEKLIMELQLHISLGGIKEIYYDHCPLLDRILKKMRDKLRLSLLSYNHITTDTIKSIPLTKDEIERKQKLQRLIIGSDKASDELEYFLSYNSEIFEEVV